MNDATFQLSYAGLEGGSSCPSPGGHSISPALVGGRRRSQPSNQEQMTEEASLSYALRAGCGVLGQGFFSAHYWKHVSTRW